MYIRTAKAREIIDADTDEAARKILEGLGVVPVDFGPGRGRGLRWPKDEIIIAMDKRRFGVKRPLPAQKRVEWTRELVVAAVHGDTKA